MANCFFIISTSSGMDDVAIVNRRPIVLVNHLPVGYCRTGSRNYIEHFKWLQWEKTGKLLSVKE